MKDRAGKRLTHQITSATLTKWLPLVVGVGLLYVPTYVDLYQTFNETEYGILGPAITAVVLWLIWRERSLFADEHQEQWPWLGILCVALGSLCYVLGRSQAVFQLQVLSQVFLLPGMAAILWGQVGLKRIWFPALLILFAMPIPGSIVEQVLLPLKLWVSQLVENMLYFAGYPVGRSGVELIVGSYSLLIADACSGLNSIIALSGIGLLYVYLVRHKNRWRGALLLFSAVPIAFAANIIRVLLLVLVTYYWGDQVGRAFHERAGFLELAFAFGAFFVLDCLLGMVWPDYALDSRASSVPRKSLA
jgi:exosortase